MLILNVQDDWLKQGGDRPSLGTLYLASYLNTKGHKVDVMDMNHSTYDDLIKYIDDEKPEFIGVSMTTPQFKEGKKVAKIIKETNPNCTVIAGGSHPSALKENVDEIFDYSVVGDGEQTLNNILQGWKPNDRVIYGVGVVQPNAKSLDNSPMPDRDLIDMNRYTLKVMNKKATTIMTSLGCPYHCTFCSEPILNNRFKSRSPELVIEEMKLIKKYEVEGLIIYDDVYTINAKRCNRISDLMIENDLNLSYRATTRANLINEKLLKKLKNSGCVELCLGVESGSDKILKINDKGMTTDTNAKAIEMIKESGIKVLTYMILGLPGETPETVEMSKQFIEKTNPDECSWYILAPFPSTPIWQFEDNMDIEIYKNEIIENDWDVCQVQKNNEDVIPYIRTSACSRDEIKSLWLSCVNWWNDRKSYM